MLLENFIVSNVIFARQAISTLYIVNPRVNRITMISGRLRHNDMCCSELMVICSVIDITNFTCILTLYGLSHKKSSGVF